MANTMLIGQTLTLIQMISPLITSISFVYKVHNITIPEYASINMDLYIKWEKIENLKKFMTGLS